MSVRASAAAWSAMRSRCCRSASSSCTARTAPSLSSSTCCLSRPCHTHTRLFFLAFFTARATLILLYPYSKAGRPVPLLCAPGQDLRKCTEIFARSLFKRYTFGFREVEHLVSTNFNVRHSTASHLLHFVGKGEPLQLGVCLPGGQLARARVLCRHAGAACVRLPSGFRQLSAVLSRHRLPLCRHAPAQSHTMAYQTLI